VPEAAGRAQNGMRRQNIGDMPYLRRSAGMSAMDVYQGKRAMRLMVALMALTTVLPNGPVRTLMAAFTAMTGLVVLRLHATRRTDVEPVNSANKNRGIDSFSDTSLCFVSHPLSAHFAFPFSPPCEGGGRGHPALHGVAQEGFAQDLQVPTLHPICSHTLLISCVLAGTGKGRGTWPVSPA
jgi:hypothetical protein